jgi:hypothetical protein
MHSSHPQTLNEWLTKAAEATGGPKKAGSKKKKAGSKKKKK